MLNWLEGPHLDLALRTAMIGLLLATGALSLRMARSEARLAQAARETTELMLEHEVRLASSQTVVAELEQESAARQAGLEADSVAARLQLVAASTALERFEAAGAAHEVRMRALLHAADPQLSEGRIQAANRMITEALRTRGA